MMKTEPHIISQRHEEILSLVLNRPRKGNAITPQMYEVLLENLTQAAQDKNIKVIEISANGDVFCAGNDRDGFRFVRDIPHPNRPGFRFMNALASFPKPIVAAVNGHAVGLGATLLLHCDFVYAVPDAELRFPFLRLGLQPEFGSTYLLAQRIGLQRTNELLMLGKPLPATQGATFGLINSVTEKVSLQVTARQTSLELIQNSLDSLITTKRLIQQPQHEATTQAIENETKAINQCLNALFPKTDHGSNQ